jgi:hypothetical protein
MKKSIVAFFAILAAMTMTQVVFAQSQLVLSINRDFGYGGFDNKIEGLFSLEAEGPEDLSRVNFFVDEDLIAATEQRPFRIQFSTNNYSPGEHRLYAIGFTSSGGELRSNEIIRVFITKEESRNAVMGIIIPTLAIIVGLMILSLLIQTLLGRKEQVGKYGILGGTVCPKCSLPFSLKVLGINWFGGKLQRCPHCGKWSVVKRANADDLATAEAKYRGEESTQISSEGEDIRIKRQIDDSRYEN